MLHALRGFTIGGALFAIAGSSGFALLAGLHGKVRIGEPGSGGLVVWALLIVAAISMIRHLRIERTSATGPTARVERFRVDCAIPQIAGMTVLMGATLVALLTGWWPAALVGGAAALTGVARGAPTATRIGRADTASPAPDGSPDLLEQLLSSPPPAAS